MLGRDFLASIVVFLVAIPLCMGIALASQVPLEYGLISGIIGGLVVGVVTGSPLQVSGPAAGLVVLVLDIVREHGLAGLGVVTFGAGLVQLVMAGLRSGPYFRAISPMVINGMLSGIGIIIFTSQFHVMLDDSPQGGVVENLFTIPQAILKIFDPSLGIPHMEAAFIGSLSIMVILLWNNLKEKYHLIVPGTLVGIVAAAVLTSLAHLPIERVNFDSDLAGALARHGLWAQDLGVLSWELLWLALPMAFIATAETLLCTNAVEKMRPDVQVNYNRELFAQGLGNALCGLVGALPLTGVIVRSRANVEAGGMTRVSTLLHGAWILIFVAFLGHWMQLIPMCSLAAILVLTGTNLMNLKGFVRQVQQDRTDAFIWLFTTVMIVASDLLVGILAGFALSLVRLLLQIHQFEIHKTQEDQESTILNFTGKASFLNLPRVSKQIDRLAQGKREITIITTELSFKDAAFHEYLQNVGAQFSKRGVTITLKD